MELNDIWNLRVGALWDPTKVEQLDSAKVTGVFDDDELKEGLNGECEDDSHAYNFTMTGCFADSSINTGDAFSQAMFHKGESHEPISFGGNLILPHIQVTIHGPNGYSTMSSFRRWLQESKPDSPESIKEFLLALKTSYGAISALSLGLVHADGTKEHHFVTKDTDCLNAEVGLGDYSDRFFHAFNSYWNPKPHEEWHDSNDFRYRTFKDCQYCVGITAPGCGGCNGTGHY